MKYLAMATILTLAILVACETEDPVGETSIIVDEGSTVVVTTSTEEQSEEQLNFMDRIVQNLAIKRNCYIGETILLEATVLVRSLFRSSVNDPWEIESLAVETNNDNLWISITMDPVSEFLECPTNYYKNGETYVFSILITHIIAERGQGWREGDPLLFSVYGEIVVTEELKKELRKVGCEDEEG